VSQEIISSDPENVQETVLDGKKPKRDSASRRWMLTVPARYTASHDDTHPDGHHLWSGDELAEALSAYDGAVVQLELGEESTEKNPGGYLHWQLYIEHSAPIRFSTLQRKFQAGDISEARGDRLTCVTYCTKVKTRVEEGGPFWFGEIRLEDFQGKRNDIVNLRNSILLEGKKASDLLYDVPGAWRYSRYLKEFESEHHRRTIGREKRQVVGEFVWGPSSVGKTIWAEEEYGYEDAYWVGSYHAGSFDGYDGESVLILDEYRGGFKIDEFLKFLRGTPLRVKARYADKWAAWTKVVVISNYPMRKLYRDIDRVDLQAIEKRFSLVREYTGPGEFIEEFEGVRL